MLSEGACSIEIAHSQCNGLAHLFFNFGKTARNCRRVVLAEAGIEPSVGNRGDSYDNALAETINGLYKTELIHRRTWKTRESVELATLEWVAWFNHHRLMEPLGYIPPAEAEANYYRQLKITAAETALT